MSYTHDTIVECQKCGRRQHLDFVNGLKNGWSKCCGYTMPIVHCTADINKAMKEAMKRKFNATLSVGGKVIGKGDVSITWDKEGEGQRVKKEKPWSVS